MTTILFCMAAAIGQQPGKPLPPDPRALIERHTDTVFAPLEFDSIDEWEAYAADLRRKILVASGLFPMPERTPLNAQVFGKVERDGYTVEKVYFEAYPGFYVTGNLYKPTGDGPFPGVACPHGHWSNGRLEDNERGSVAARSITFARMGIVSFSYDMVGYVDSLQVSRNWSHSGGNVPAETRREQALWGLHPSALQLWSGVRVLDFLESLPEVDPDKLGCTGASGGGTQTFLLTAIDNRVKVAAPVNMISHTMQGGCPCENAPLIRYHASNMEIGALAAPRPLMMVSATGDWTKATPEVEYPAIRHIYSLFGVPERVREKQIDAPHNYNQASREAVYPFFGEFLLGEADKYRDFKEPPYSLEPVEDLRVFPDGQLPDGSLMEAEIFEQFISSRKARLADHFRAAKSSGDGLPDEWRDALGDVFGIDLLHMDGIEARESSEATREGDTEVRRVTLHVPSTGARIPMRVMKHAARNYKGAVLFVDALATPNPLLSFRPPELAVKLDIVRQLLEDGYTVYDADPFLTGDNAGTEGKYARRTDNFSDTFVPTVDAWRVQDIIAAHAYLDKAGHANAPVIGFGGAGVWTVFAAALGPVDGPVIADMNGMDPDSDADWLARCYAPSLRAVGDIYTAVWLSHAPSITFANVGGALDSALLPEGRWTEEPETIHWDIVDAALNQ